MRSAKGTTPGRACWAGVHFQLSLHFILGGEPAGRLNKRLRASAISRRWERNIRIFQSERGAYVRGLYLLKSRHRGGAKQVDRRVGPEDEGDHRPSSKALGMDYPVGLSLHAGPTTKAYKGRGSPGSGKKPFHNMSSPSWGSGTGSSPFPIRQHHGRRSVWPKAGPRPHKRVDRGRPKLDQGPPGPKANRVDPVRLAYVARKPPGRPGANRGAGGLTGGTTLAKNRIASLRETRRPGVLCPPGFIPEHSPQTPGVRPGPCRRGPLGMSQRCDRWRSSPFRS